MPEVRRSKGEKWEVDQLLERLAHGEEEALTELCQANIGLIRKQAWTIAEQYNCLRWDEQGGLSAYTKETLSELESVGMVTLIELVRSGGYDNSKGKFLTYVAPFLEGDMRRHLEINMGCLSVSRDDMTTIRKVQSLYFREGKSVGEISAALGISYKAAARAVAYPTHFLSAFDLAGEDDAEGGSVFEGLEGWLPPPSVEEAVFRKLSLEDLEAVFHTLSMRDQDVIGGMFGVFGHPGSDLRDIAIRNCMKEDGVEKAKRRILDAMREKCLDGYAWKLRRARRMVDRAQER